MPHADCSSFARTSAVQDLMILSVFVVALPLTNLITLRASSTEIQASKHELK